MRIGLLSSFDDPLLGYLLRELTLCGVTVDAVLLDSMRWTDKDRRIYEERTRGRLPWISPWDMETSAPFYFVADHRSDATIQKIRHLKLDLLVNAGTPRILNKSILESAPLGVLNCHPGLLPQFRGCTCVEWALYLNEPIGNTAHFMDEGIDSGPILCAEPVPLSPGDSYVDIRVKVYQHGVNLLARAMRRIRDEKILPRSLPEQGEGRYFPVIDADKMASILEQLSKGGYRPAVLN